MKKTTVFSFIALLILIAFEIQPLNICKPLEYAPPLWLDGKDKMLWILNNGNFSNLKR